MFDSHKKILKVAALLGAVFATGGWTAVEAATIRFEPTPKTVNAGDSFSLALRGIGFADTLDGGGVNIAFDPSIVYITGVTINTGIWDFFTSVGAIDNTLGNVADIIFNALLNVTGDFAVATIQFQAVGVGSTALSLTESALNPFASGGNLLPVTLIDGSVQVNGSTVPEPATWLLLLTGFGLATRLDPKGRKS